MKLERLHEYVTAAAATVVGMTLAVMCGTLTGRGQTGILLGILMTLGVGALVLGLKQRVWILIPMFWSLTGRIRELPIPFAVRDILIISVFIISLIFIALKIVRGKAHYTKLDLLFFGMLVYLLTTFLRNPVGVDALNSTRVGGRPYFDIMIATLGFWILSRVHLNERDARVFPTLVALGGMINGALNAITFNVPATVPWMTRFYSGLSGEASVGNEIDPSTGLVNDTPTRHAYLGALGWPLVALLFAHFPPIRVINPARLRIFILFLLGVACILGSGFRSLVLTVLVAFCISSYLRTGWRDVIRLGLVAAPFMALVIMGQGRIYQLPFGVQRTLSFLPGAWDPVAVAQAKHSTQWRLYMWRVVLTEDKYIINKWLGDGFGFTKREFEQMKRSQFMGGSEQESFMITGGVHSGPISAIRYVGIVGLFFFTIMMVMMARYAWVLMKRAKGTPYFPLAIYLGTPFVYLPFEYWIVFGSFDGSFANAAFGLGLLNMVRNSLDRAALPALAPTGDISKVRPLKPRSRRPEARGDRGIPAGVEPGPVWQPRPR